MKEVLRETWIYLNIKNMMTVHLLMKTLKNYLYSRHQKITRYTFTNCRSMQYTVDQGTPSTVIGFYITDQEELPHHQKIYNQWRFNQLWRR
jgi:hypothetical protein